MNKLCAVCKSFTSSELQAYKRRRLRREPAVVVNYSDEYFRMMPFVHFEVVTKIKPEHEITLPQPPSLIFDSLLFLRSFGVQMKTQIGPA